MTKKGRQVIRITFVTEYDDKEQPFSLETFARALEQGGIETQMIEKNPVHFYVCRKKKPEINLVRLKDES